VGKLRRQLILIQVTGPNVPGKAAWLNSEMIKTQVTHRYCSRHESAGACSSANICKNSTNSTSGPKLTDALAEQFDDIQTLKANVEQRGWDCEAASQPGTPPPR
jgi:hypothetical protein